jgi:vacuolar-type H+-ATPase subunit I/STV1
MNDLRARLNSFAAGISTWVWLFGIAGVFVFLIVKIRNVNIGR